MESNFGPSILGTLGLEEESSEVEGGTCTCFRYSGV